MKVLKIFMEKHNLLPEKQHLSNAMVTNNTSQANLIIARALGDFLEFSLAWSHIIRAPARVCI